MELEKYIFEDIKMGNFACIEIGFLCISGSLSPYSTGNGVRVGNPTHMKSTQKNEMYMANARNLHLGPNATYIPLTRIAGFPVTQRKRYQHVGIGNAKVWPLPVPNANGFASQWNIGLRLL